MAFATPQDAYAEPAAAATQAALSGDKTRTTLRIEMTAGVTAEIFTLANPYRVIVDLPDVSFRLPDGTGQTGTGLVQTFRYGLFADKKARIVLDTTGPVRIERAAMTAAPADKGIIFTFDMVTTAPESFGLGTGADRAAEDARRRAAGRRQAQASGQTHHHDRPRPRRHRRRRCQRLEHPREERRPRCRQGTRRANCPQAAGTTSA